MAVFELRFVVFFFWCFVHLSAVEPPICQDSDIFTTNIDHEWHVRCPPTEACNLGLVKYKLTKDPQVKDNEWKLNETSTCYLCAPTCCGSVDHNVLSFTSWYDSACAQYLLSYGFNSRTTNVWNRYDKEELIYVVLKQQIKQDVYLLLPGQELCTYIVNDHKYVKKVCYVAQPILISGTVCPQGRASDDMCTQPKKIGQ